MSETASGTHIDEAGSLSASPEATQGWFLVASELDLTVVLLHGNQFATPAYLLLMGWADEQVERHLRGLAYEI